jgi:hypothetical protein
MSRNGRLPAVVRDRDPRQATDRTHQRHQNQQMAHRACPQELRPFFGLSIEHADLRLDRVPLRFFGARTFLSASVLSQGTERTRMSALQREAKPASEELKMRTARSVDRRIVDCVAAVSNPSRRSRRQRSRRRRRPRPQARRAAARPQMPGGSSGRVRRERESALGHWPARIIAQAHHEVTKTTPESAWERRGISAIPDRTELGPLRTVFSVSSVSPW